MTFFEELNQHFSIVQYLELILRIVIAAICGGIVGIERTRRLKNAGMRTHCIVACTAALIMIISKYGFADMTDLAGASFSGTHGTDPARLAAQIVSGIGFLGAGIIYRDKNGLTKGITTAAGIWAVAGIGMAFGSGLYLIGIFATVFVVLIQLVLHMHHKGEDPQARAELKIEIENDKGAIARVHDTLTALGVEVLESSMIKSESLISYTMKVKIPKKRIDHELSEYFANEESIKSIKLSPNN